MFLLAESVESPDPTARILGGIAVIIGTIVAGILGAVG